MLSVNSGPNKAIAAFKSTFPYATSDKFSKETLTALSAKTLSIMNNDNRFSGPRFIPGQNAIFNISNYSDNLANRPKNNVPVNLCLAQELAPASLLKKTFKAGLKDDYTLGLIKEGIDKAVVEDWADDFLLQRTVAVLRNSVRSSGQTYAVRQKMNVRIISGPPRHKIGAFISSIVKRMAARTPTTVGKFSAWVSMSIGASFVDPELGINEAIKVLFEQDPVPTTKMATTPQFNLALKATLTHIRRFLGQLTSDGYWHVPVDELTRGLTDDNTVLVGENDLIGEGDLPSIMTGVAYLIAAFNVRLRHIACEQNLTASGGSFSAVKMYTVNLPTSKEDIMGIVQSGGKSFLELNATNIIGVDGIPMDKVGIGGLLAKNSHMPTHLAYLLSSSIHAAFTLRNPKVHEVIRAFSTVALVVYLNTFGLNKVDFCSLVAFTPRDTKPVMYVSPFSSRSQRYGDQMTIFLPDQPLLRLRTRIVKDDTPVITIPACVAHDKLFKVLLGARVKVLQNNHSFMVKSTSAMVIRTIFAALRGIIAESVINDTHSDLTLMSNSTRRDFTTAKREQDAVAFNNFFMALLNMKVNGKSVKWGSYKKVGSFLQFVMKGDYGFKLKPQANIRHLLFPLPNEAKLEGTGTILYLDSGGSGNSTDFREAFGRICKVHKRGLEVVCVVLGLPVVTLSRMFETKKIKGRLIICPTEEFTLKNEKGYTVLNPLVDRALANVLNYDLKEPCYTVGSYRAEGVLQKLFSRSITTPQGKILNPLFYSAHDDESSPLVAEMTKNPRRGGFILLSVDNYENKLNVLDNRVNLNPPRRQPAKKEVDEGWVQVGKGKKAPTRINTPSKSSTKKAPIRRNEGSIDGAKIDLESPLSRLTSFCIGGMPFERNVFAVRDKVRKSSTSNAFLSNEQAVGTPVSVLEKKKGKGRTFVYPKDSPTQIPSADTSLLAADSIRSDSKERTMTVFRRLMNLFKLIQSSNLPPEYFNHINKELHTAFITLKFVDDVPQFGDYSVMKLVGENSYIKYCLGQGFPSKRASLTLGPSEKEGEAAISPALVFGSLSPFIKELDEEDSIEFVVDADDDDLYVSTKVFATANDEELFYAFAFKVNGDFPSLVSRSGSNNVVVWVRLDTTGLNVSTDKSADQYFDSNVELPKGCHWYALVSGNDELDFEDLEWTFFKCSPISAGDSIVSLSDVMVAFTTDSCYEMDSVITSTKLNRAPIGVTGRIFINAPCPVAVEANIFLALAASITELKGNAFCDIMPPQLFDVEQRGGGCIADVTNCSVASGINSYPAFRFRMFFERNCYARPIGDGANISSEGIDNAIINNELKFGVSDVDVGFGPSCTVRADVQTLSSLSLPSGGSLSALRRLVFADRQALFDDPTFFGNVKVTSQSGPSMLPLIRTSSTINAVRDGANLVASPIAYSVALGGRNRTLQC